MLDGQAFLPGGERGPAEGDPGMGDVVTGARAGEGLQGADGEFAGAARVAVAEQELGARVPYLRAFQGSLFKSEFKEVQSYSRPVGRHVCAEWPSVIGVENAPGFEMSDRALDRGA